MNNWDPLPFDALTSPFALQEHLSDLVIHHCHDIPMLITPPDASIDKDVWQYEHLRRVCMELHHLVCKMESVCNEKTCPEMKADEWLYLCAAHPQPQNV